MANTQQAYDPRKYREGETVRICGRPVLEEFLRTWEHHHKLDPEQLAYAGRTVRITWTGIYHGGDVLYHLEGIPGIWHEQLLEAA